MLVGVRTGPPEVFALWATATRLQAVKENGYWKCFSLPRILPIIIFMRNSSALAFTLGLASSLLFLLGLRDLLDPERRIKAEPTKESQLAIDLENLFSSVAEN